MPTHAISLKLWPLMIIASFTIALQPVFTDGLNHIQVKSSETAYFKFDFYSLWPNVTTCEWHKGHCKLTVSKKYQFSPLPQIDPRNSTTVLCSLEILNVSVDDEGKYSCTIYYKNFSMKHNLIQVELKLAGNSSDDSGVEGLDSSAFLGLFGASAFSVILVAVILYKKAAILDFLRSCLLICKQVYQEDVERPRNRENEPLLNPGCQFSGGDELRTEIHNFLNNENATLKDENALLKIENDELKRQLIQKESAGLMNIEWKEGTPAPVGRADHTAAWLNGLVYVGGGYESGNTNSYKIDCYDPIKDLWSSPINTPYRHFAIVTLNNKLLAVGGVDKNTNRTNEILIMDDDHLNNYTKMNEARSWAAAAGYQGMLIIAGGIGNERILASTECFDSNNKQWYTCDDLPQPSYCLRSVVVDNILYLSGGATECGGDSPAVFTSPLDTLSKHQLEWKSCQDIEIPCSAPALVSVDDKFLLIVGGVRWKEIPMDTHTLDVYRLSKVDRSWKAIGNIPLARKSPAAVCTVNNRIIVIGGWNHKGEYTNTVWIGSYALANC